MQRPEVSDLPVEPETLRLGRRTPQVRTKNTSFSDPSGDGSKWELGTWLALPPDELARQPCDRRAESPGTAGLALPLGPHEWSSDQWTRPINPRVDLRVSVSHDDDGTARARDMRRVSAPGRTAPTSFRAAATPHQFLAPRNPIRVVARWGKVPTPWGEIRGVLRPRPDLRSRIGLNLFRRLRHASRTVRCVPALLPG